MTTRIQGVLIGLGIALAQSRASAQAKPEAGQSAGVTAPSRGESPAGQPESVTPEAIPPAVQSELKAEQERLRALETRLDEVQAKLVEERRVLDKQQQELERQRLEAQSQRLREQAQLEKSRRAEPPWYSRIQIQGYLQAQYENHQDSEDQLAPGGQPLNQDRFLVRRARLTAAYAGKYSAFALELDGNTVRGASFGLQRAEASVLWRGTDAAIEHPPLVQLTAGLFYLPFGRELTESSRERPFMERSLASRAFFPGEADLGVRIAGELGFFRYAVAVVNGEPLGTKSGFPWQDPNAAKDVLGRVGVDAAVSDVLKAAAGVSVLNGKGFRKGTDNTKSTLVWNDTNENGQYERFELTASPGTTGIPSQNFEHWAVGADLALKLQTALGQTQLLAEAALASNLDRGQFVADPTIGPAAREFGYNVAVSQDLTRHALVGLRYDYYDPQSDLFERRNGRLVPYVQTVKTWSPLVGVRLPERTKLSVQYDIVRDHLARDRLGVPTDLANNTLTVRLQGEL